MSLVTYSDSEDDTGNTGKGSDETSKSIIGPVTHSKRKRMNEDESQRSSRPSSSAPPPLPSGFTSLYATAVRSGTSDDPSLHSGRKRQIPHVEGNWPSFVYLEWLPSSHDLASLEDVISSFITHHANSPSSPTSNGRLRSSLRSSLGVRLPLHVSLSNPLILTTANKEDFEETLTRTINEANIAAFSTTPTAVRCVDNFEGTRRFLIITLSKPKQDELQHLLSLCNSTATSFSLPQLYTSTSGTKTNSMGVGVVSTPSIDITSTANEHVKPDDERFHISIGWSIGQMQTSESILDELRERLGHMTITFDTVHIKVGNHVSSVQLRSQQAEVPNLVSSPG